MIAVVVPSNRPASLARWVREWDEQLADARLYVVHDEPETWAAIRRDLGEAAWIIPCQTDCVRAYGFWRAWRDGATHIITLDDDCYPLDGAEIARHVRALDELVEPDGWVRTLDIPTRGLPLTRPVGINHGLWMGVPDVSAEYQLAHGEPIHYVVPPETLLPVGAFAPLSGMNLAWRAELTPLMYFTLQGADLRAPDRGWGVHRFGDIWCGLFAKRICDHLGYAVRSGTPFVRHERASDPHVNLARERVGQRDTATLWPHVRDVRLTARTPVEAYHELADGLGEALDGAYWATLVRAMHTWAGLFERGR